VVLGAGGAARATLAAARELGASATVFARRPSAAEALAKEFGAAAGAPGEGAPAGLVVHATNVGREPGSSLEVPIAPWLGRLSHLLDWVYAPNEPVVRRAAERAGASYEDGWRLLVYQAAASYEIWWGRPPAEASVVRSVEEGPCAG